MQRSFTASLPMLATCLAMLVAGILPVHSHVVGADEAVTLETGFLDPPRDARPETWFHLIGGNVSKQWLTTDLEAVSGAGLQGIQLFHGKGSEWPGVAPQITCLSPAWDDMIAHVADETRRLGLQFTMQNCPGWAMSGGPWITPDKAMRHLIWSRHAVSGGGPLTLELSRPQPSDEDWRDYRDIAVLAFPTPLDDDGGFVMPVHVRGHQPRAAWADLLAGRKGVTVQVDPGEQPGWVEFTFADPISVRSIELPPIEHLMRRRNFDPDSSLLIQALAGDGWRDLVRHQIPRGTWQDR